MSQVYAEDVNYWRTGTSSPDMLISRTKREIIAAGGRTGNCAIAQDEFGRAACMLEFSFGGERFRAVWPALPSRTGNERAALIQAATMLYHDIKAKAVSAKVHGVRAAFFQFLLLPDGRTAARSPHRSW